MQDDLQDIAAGQETVAFGHFAVRRQANGELWELGRGAMGVTYRAFDTSLQTDVALKVIRAEKVSDEGSRRRFQREARAAAKIRHLNVANVLHLGEQDGNYFYAMEYVKGRSLEAVLEKEGGKLPAPIALALLAQAAAALNAAHQEGVVHRDLKPANVMIIEGEDLNHEDERTKAAGGRLLKVIDFGLARHFGASGTAQEDDITRSFAGFMGTPAYASPEQCMEDEVDGRTDLYSLGIILWQMLVGKRPFGGRLHEVIARQMSDPPPILQLEGVPPPLVHLLEGLLIKDRDQRKPQTAAELRTALDQLWKSPNLVSAGADRPPLVIPIRREEAAPVRRQYPATRAKRARPWPLVRVAWLAAAGLSVILLVQIAGQPDGVPSIDTSIQPPLIGLDLTDAVDSPQSRQLTLKQGEINAFLGGAVHRTKDPGVLDRIFEFKRTYVLLTPGVCHIGMEETFFGKSLYFGTNYKLEFQDGIFSPVNIGGNLGRLSIHPLLMHGCDYLFSRVWTALHREDQNMRRLAAVQIDLEQITLTTKGTATK